MKPEKPDAGQFAAWWRAHRDQVSILGIAAVALGGIVCMVAAVLVVVLQ